MSQQIAELRRWYRILDTFFGYVYNDPNDNWDDGEFAELEVDVLADSGGFYILKSAGKTLFKLYKDEERK